ncbi:hypothetical protein BD410DRAFT_795103 [Rickenella mellea]|uniref:BTB domain-containing protein n=1 Tax=Rickenella mellea TaxID=50990 RepID=A0A4Y7PPC4_9AGAM|nr:hypothetical protein BD410DRAFT_795103 [Rickenella mellea]
MFSSPVTDRIRHPTLWFDDGNIILTTKVSLFRVHRGLLSMNSPVFADMLSIPQPDHIEDGYEGLPVVEISDNDAYFTHLLCFFYDHRYYQGGTETTFEKISGLLRMSTKYQMDDLRNEIISHLALAYPSTLEKYLEVVNAKTQLPLFPPFHGQHFAVVALAREIDASILLPAALWRSMCMPTQDILQGAVDLNGTRHILSPTDIQLCILKKSEEYKRQVGLEHFFGAMMKRTPTCDRQNQRVGNQGVSPCAEIPTDKVLRHFLKTEETSRDNHDMLARLDALEVWRPLICETCRECADSLISISRENYWLDLPSVFELPKWSG